jgi:alanine racemase
MLESVRPAPPLAVFLKVNTGMNRLGISVDRIGAALARLAATGSVAEITLMTHFADADGPEGVTAQLARFEAATRGLALPRSLANSAALLRHPQTRADWVRPGIMLYGCSPFADEAAQALGLRPVMTLASELIAVRHLAAGEHVGYGSTFTAERAMRIGVVACGYADGYPRHAPTGTPIVVAGRRTRTVGRVSMDMLAVDLDGIPEAGIGTPVTLWGDGLSCDEVAAAAGTVSYELLCALATRVPQTERT